jgi:hypothetical protein
LDSVASSFPDVEYIYAVDGTNLKEGLSGTEILVIGNRAYDPQSAEIIETAGSSLKWVQWCAGFTSPHKDSMTKIGAATKYLQIIALR